MLRLGLGVRFIKVQTLLPLSLTSNLPVKKTMLENKTVVVELGESWPRILMCLSVVFCEINLLYKRGDLGSTNPDDMTVIFNFYIHM